MSGLRLLQEDLHTVPDPIKWGYKGREPHSRCRVSDQTDNSWTCIRHQCHIINCLNERIERETLAMREELKNGLG